MFSSTFLYVCFEIYFLWLREFAQTFRRSHDYRWGGEGETLGKDVGNVQCAPESSVAFSKDQYSCLSHFQVPRQSSSKTAFIGLCLSFKDPSWALFRQNPKLIYWGFFYLTFELKVKCGVTKENILFKYPIYSSCFIGHLITMAVFFVSIESYVLFTYLCLWAYLLLKGLTGWESRQRNILNHVFFKVYLVVVYRIKL